jgi:hypothetical protein
MINNAKSQMNIQTIYLVNYGRRVEYETFVSPLLTHFAKSNIGATIVTLAGIAAMLLIAVW